MKTLTQKTKDKYVARALSHQKADEIIKGRYWRDGKGCCIGCLAHTDIDAHESLEKQTYTPEWLHRVADQIHEELPDDLMRKRPVRYMSAMPVGLSFDEFEKQIKAPFMIFVLQNTLDNFNHDEYPDVKSTIDDSIALWKRDDIGSDEWSAATYASTYASTYAARSAAWSVVESAARSAASSAAYINFSDKLVELMTQARGDNDDQ
jgi:hypothetical protein